MTEDRLAPANADGSSADSLAPGSANADDGRTDGIDRTDRTTIEEFARRYARELLTFVWYGGLALVSLFVASVIDPRTEFSPFATLARQSVASVLVGTVVVLLPLKAFYTTGTPRPLASTMTRRTAVLFVLLLFFLLFGTPVVGNAADLMEGGHVAF